MYVLLSPAKKLHEPPAVPGLPATQPTMLDQSEVLMKSTRNKSANKLKKLMHISDKLAALNHERFQAWGQPFTADNSRQAILSFAGDVYLGLDAGSLDSEALSWAQDHVGILSGLYGVLRPLDLMQPYRLEMGTSLTTRRGATLYAFWGDRITKQVNELAAGGVVVNLASNEYFSSIAPKKLGRVVTPVFQDVKDGKARSISFFAKKARGAMTRWIIDNRVTDVEQLKEADAMNYRYDVAASEGDRWVFRRQQPPPVGETRA